MPCLLLTDCLNEIFENLEDDKITLHSCLLVNRLWCKTSVRILWRNIWSFKYSVTPNRKLEVASAILSTLISCLPNESKELLHKNEIIISTPTSKPLLFNYASFCKALSISAIGYLIKDVLKSDTSIASQNLKGKNYLISKEILKMFMSQVSSLKSLTSYQSHHMKVPDNILFTSFPGARDCLTDLSELRCSSIIHSEIFYGLSQICHNLRSLSIDFKSEVTNELKELVSSQNNLKNLKLISDNPNNLADIIPTLMKHSNTLTTLELVNVYFDKLPFDYFKKLQYVTFPKLQILKVFCHCSNSEYIMKFLEINGKNLKEFYVKDNNLSVSITKFCPKLKKLYVLFNKDESDMLKIILNSCQDLEGIVIRCGVSYLNEKEVLETLAKHSPKNFYELKLYDAELIPEDLESFFVSWKNRVSKKSLSLIMIACGKPKMTEESMKIIEKYQNLGVIKFKTRKYFQEGLYLYP